MALKRRCIWVLSTTKFHIITLIYFDVERIFNNSKDWYIVYFIGSCFHFCVIEVCISIVLISLNKLVVPSLYEVH